MGWIDFPVLRADLSLLRAKDANSFKIVQYFSRVSISPWLKVAILIRNAPHS